MVLIDSLSRATQCDRSYGEKKLVFSLSSVRQLKSVQHTRCLLRPAEGRLFNAAHSNKHTKKRSFFVCRSRVHARLVRSRYASILCIGCSAGRRTEHRNASFRNERHRVRTHRKITSQAANLSSGVERVLVVYRVCAAFRLSLPPFGGILGPSIVAIRPGEHEANEPGRATVSERQPHLARCGQAACSRRGGL